MPVLVHKAVDMLNTIMEVDEDYAENTADQYHPTKVEKPAISDISGLQYSDQFPTPRGKHFMPTPILTSDVSSVEGDDLSERSVLWSRDSISTQTTEFDDLYDVSVTEREYLRRSGENASNLEHHSIVSDCSANKRISLPILVVPSTPVAQNYSPHRDYSSCVSPTFSTRMPLSPAILSYLLSHDIPSSSAPPSLDGSLSSDQLSGISPPTTPDIGTVEAGELIYGDMRLPADAIATLHTILGEDALYDQLMEQIVEVPPLSPTIEMQQTPPPMISLIRRHESIVLPPHQQRFLDSLTRLDIPSPGGFFSNPSEESQCAWLFEPILREPPLSSSTAEHFYKTPWTGPSLFTERDDSCSVEPEESELPDLQCNSNNIVCGNQMEEDVAELIEWNDYDEAYVRKLEQTASEHSDRTKSWLATQKSYITNLINPPEERSDEVALAKRASEAHRNSATVGVPDEKVVRFAEETRTALTSSRSGCSSLYPIFYTAFLAIITQSHYQNAFIHRLPRFQALQTQRSSFKKAFLKQLLSQYEHNNTHRNVEKRNSANVARGDEMVMTDPPPRIKADQQRMALSQILPTFWHLEALKMLWSGRLFISPITKRLARLSSLNPTSNRAYGSKQVRVLDLGGRPVCDWAWHVAFAYPDVTVCSVVAKTQLPNETQNIKGPQNQQIITTPTFKHLPFPNAHFHCVSARSLFALLRTTNTRCEDEWSACLAEIYRILKPGGYLEFHLVDSDILNPGPLSISKNKVFTSTLIADGFDPQPTKSFLSRLYSAGFINIKRAWTFLPIGAPNPPRPDKRDTFGVEIKDRSQGGVYGTTGDIAPLAGLVGAVEWEKWMAEVDVGKGGDGSCLRDNWDVFEEGRMRKSGWRVLDGYAIKPY